MTPKKKIQKPANILTTLLKYNYIKYPHIKIYRNIS